MTLRKAIKKLADFDGWVICQTVENGIGAQYCKSLPHIWIFETEKSNSINAYVAAAKTLGFMIGFVPHYSKNKYLVSPCIADMKSEKFWFLEKDEKDEPAAIIAAFKAVMEIAKKE